MRIAAQGKNNKKKEPLLGGNFCIYNFSPTPKRSSFTPSLKCHRPCHRLLQELGNGVEGSGNTGDGDVGHVGHGSTGAGRAAARPRAGAGRRSGARLAVGSGGVRGGGLALVLATNDTVVLHLLELGALELAVSALQVETTVDLLQGTHVNTR